MTVLDGFKPEAGAETPAGLAPEERDAIARALAISLRSTASDLGDASDRRWWRVVATESFDAWLIDWPPGTSVPRHDHDGAEASLCVVRGELVEHTFDGPEIGATSVLPPDLVHRVAAESSHEVVNLAPSSATSVHVYSPPLRSLGFYDDLGETTRRDVVEPVPALWKVDLP